MESIKIQYELKKRKIMQKDIARALGITDIIVSKTINKQMVSDRVMRAVARAIERHPRDVFPEYYNAPPKRATSKVA